MNVSKGTIKKSHGQGALVVATGHDRVTKQLLTVAKKAAQMLESVDYRVFSFYKEEATCLAIYVKLLEIAKVGMQVSTGFLSAHGSDNGLHDRSGNILIDATLCEQLAGSILVISACLQEGDLPKKCVKNDNSVKACIGFKRKLWAPTPKWWSILVKPILAKEALKNFKSCVLKPLDSLLKGRSVKNSTIDAKRMWRQKAKSIGKSDTRLALVFQVNYLNLDYWGHGSAKL